MWAEVRMNEPACKTYARLMKTAPTPDRKIVILHLTDVTRLQYYLIRKLLKGRRNKNFTLLYRHKAINYNC